MSRVTMTWDGDADQQLLLSILATHAIKVDYDAIAARLGPPCTPRAAQERIKKLKKMAKERGFDTSVPAATPIDTPTKTPTGTPKKRKTTTPTKGAKKGGRVKKGTPTETASEEDDEEGDSIVKAEKGENLVAREDASGTIKRDWDKFAEDAGNDADADAV